MQSIVFEPHGSEPDRPRPQPVVETQRSTPPRFGRARKKCRHASHCDYRSSSFRDSIPFDASITIRARAPSIGMQVAISTLKELKDFICHLTSAISGGTRSARRLLIAACPRRRLSLQAACRREPTAASHS